jgi:hypothetical protein
MLLASMPLLVDLVVNPVYDYPIHILLARRTTTIDTLIVD